MATQGYIYDESFIADGAIPTYRVVVIGEASDVDAQGKHCKLPGAQDAASLLGVSQNATTASGDTVLVRRAGLTKVEVASGNITGGIALRAFDIRGMVDRQAGAWISGDGVVGYAEENSAASGDVIECWLAIRTLLG